jgi:hypothetical protein
MSGILAVDGIKKELEGKRDQALAELRVYLQAPVGIGEHGGICEEIKNKLLAVGNCDSIIDTIDKYVKVTEEGSNTAEDSAENE